VGEADERSETFEAFGVAEIPVLVGDLTVGAVAAESSDWHESPRVWVVPGDVEEPTLRIWA